MTSWPLKWFFVVVRDSSFGVGRMTLGQRENGAQFESGTRRHCSSETCCLGKRISVHWGSSSTRGRRRAGTILWGNSRRCAGVTDPSVVVG
jgi:hypothetical protein